MSSLSITRRSAAGEFRASSPPFPAAAKDNSARYERRRQDVIEAAIPILNSRGFGGMRLTDVAEQLGLGATAVTHYFPRKEELALACFDNAMTALHAMLDAADAAPTPAQRIARFVALFVARNVAVRRGEAPSLASFGCMRALDDRHRARANAGYRRIFRRVRSYVQAIAPGLDKTHASMRTLALLEQLYWADRWLGDFDLETAPRIAARISDIMLDGLAAPGASLALGEADLARAAEDRAASDRYLLAATREINAHGYRGASVNRIAARMNVSKWSFYQHIEAKDDLVAACFRRGFDVIRGAQLAAGDAAAGNSDWARLTAAVSSLVAFQVSEEGPLLRASALSSMPADLQAEVVTLTYKATRQFAVMISDAIAEGGARVVDNIVAAHMLHAAINAAAELRTEGDGQVDALDYVRPLFFGLTSA
jgi:AcrR family transcriptional regulator